MKPDNFGTVVNSSLHNFPDAFVPGCGQCNYIRIVNEIGRVHCNLLLGKPRVTPKKFISFPRLELNAAVFSVKMAYLLKKELKLEEMKEWFWTHSNVVRSTMMPEGSRHLLLTNYNKLEGILMSSNGAMFQQEKTLLMVLLEV